MTITIRAPTQEALESIAARMCEADVEELAVMGKESLAALLTGVQKSREAYVAYWHGEPQAVFGVADYELDGNVGIPWLLSTGPRGRIARAFMEESHRFIAEWIPLYTALANLVHSRHLRAQRWLLSLGFMPMATHDINGHSFIEFGLIQNV